MHALRAIPSTGFARLHPQEASRCRAGIGWQAGILFESTSPYRLRAHHAALSGRDDTLFASCGLRCGGVFGIADGRHEHTRRLPPCDRRRHAAPCVSLAASTLRAVERLPQFAASSAATGHRSVRCGKPPCAFGVIDVGMQGAIATVRAAALRGLSVAIATIVSVMRSLYYWRSAARPNRIQIIAMRSSPPMPHR